MGLLDKIEDKFTRSGGKDEDQAGRASAEDTTSNRVVSSTSTDQHSSRQHPIGSASTNTPGSAITGGTALESGALASSHDATGSRVPGSFPGESGYGNTVIPDRTRGDHTTTSGRNVTGATLGDHSGVAGSNTTHTAPRKPYDPYSSSGQQIAANAADERNTYGASNNRGPAGDVGSRRNHEDTSVLRTQHGGVSNQLHTGPHSELENRDAVPTAGGQRVGTSTTYDSSSQGGQSQYGRDAALTGGVATAGLSTAQGRDTTGIDSNRDTSQKTVGPHSSDLMNKLDPRVDSNPTKAYGAHSQTTTSDRPDHPTGYQGHSSQDALYSSGSQTQHHYGRDAGIVGSAGSVGSGAASQYSNRERDPQGLSYSSRPAADQPLAQSRDFNARHDTIGTGVATGAGSGATAYGSARDSTYQHAGGNSYGQGPTASSNDRGVFNNVDSRFDGDTSKGHGMIGSTSHSHTSTGSILNSRHAGYDTARQNHGGGTYGVGYEKGYEAGYRDALAHAESFTTRR